MPVTVLRGREDNGRWTVPDTMMALALTAYEDGICSGCGLPASHRLGDENVGRYEADLDVICHGCETKESALESNKDPYPGQKLALVESV